MKKLLFIFLCFGVLFADVKPKYTGGGGGGSGFADSSRISVKAYDLISDLTIESMAAPQIILKDGVASPYLSLWNYSGISGYTGAEISYNSLYNGSNWIRQDTLGASHCIYHNGDNFKYEFWIEPPNGDSIVTWSSPKYSFDTTGVIDCSGAIFDNLPLQKIDTVLTLKADGTIGYIDIDSIVSGGATLLSYAENGTFSTAPSATGTNAIAMGFDADVSGNFSVVGGGLRNTVSQTYATISGGSDNTVSCSYSAIVGGDDNGILAGAEYGFIGGGKDNGISTGDYTVVSGGLSNISSNIYAVVSGGNDNTSSGNGSVVSGGQANIASAWGSSILGGQNNTASGNYSTIAGGIYNSTTNSYSFVYGRDVDITTAYQTQFYDSVNKGYFCINTNDAITPTYSLAVGGGILADSIDIRSMVIELTTVNASTYSILKTDNIINVTYSTTGACAITIPTALNKSGRILTIKDGGGNAGTNTITIDCQDSGDKIDGNVAGVTLTSDYDSINLYSDGTDWFIY